MDDAGNPVDLDGDGIACEEPDDLSATVSRGRCLFLEVTGSSDRQDDIDAFEFEVLRKHPETGEPEILLTRTLDVSMPAGVLSSSGLFLQPIELRMLPGWPANSGPDGEARLEVDVIARAIDEEGGRSESEPVRVVLVNEAPVASGPGLQTVPGEAVWDPTAHQLLTLEGSFSEDADGDPLRYCWAQYDSLTQQDRYTPAGCGSQEPGGPPQFVLASFSTSSQLVLDLPPAGNQNAFVSGRLWVSDGSSVSRKPAGWTVNRQSVPTWGYAEDQGTLERLDLREASVKLLPMVERQTIVLGRNGVNAMVAVPQTAQSNRIVVQDIKTQLPGADATLMDTLIFGMDDDVFFLHPDVTSAASTRVWVFSRVSGIPPTLRLHLVEITPVSNELTLLGSVDTQVPVDITDAPIAAVHPGSGELWFAPFFGSSYSRASFDGATVSFELLDTLPAGRIVTGIGVLPDHTTNPVSYEMLVVQGRSPFVPEDNASSLPASVIAWSENDATRFIDFEMSDGTPFEATIAWGLEIADRVVWTNLFSYGLARATYFGGDEDRIVIEEVLEDVPLGFLSTVRQDGSLVALSASRFTVTQATADGVYSVIPTESQGVGVWRNRDQGTVFMVHRPDSSSFSYATETEGAGLERTVAEIGLPPAFGAPAIDYAGGSAWVGTVLPTAVSRYLPDGRKLRTIRAVRPRGAPPSADQSLLPAAFLAADPSGGTLWYLPVAGLQDQSARRIVKIDTSERIGTSDVAFVDPAFADPLLDLPGLVTVTDATVQPATDAGDRRVVLLGRFGTGWGLIRMDYDGTLDPAAPVPLFTNTAEGAVFSRSLEDGEICVASFTRGADPRVEVRRFARDLTLAGSASIPLPNVDDVTVAAGSRVCWIGTERVGSQPVFIWYDAEDERAVVEALTISPRDLVASPFAEGNVSIWASGGSTLFRIQGFSDTGLPVSPASPQFVDELRLTEEVASETYRFGSP